jgi:hypothetical protein
LLLTSGDGSFIEVEGDSSVIFSAVRNDGIILD